MSTNVCSTPHPAHILEYRLIAKKGEGTFSEVLKAQSIKNGQYWAIKCMKNNFDNIGKFYFRMSKHIDAKNIVAIMYAWRPSE